MRVRSLYSTAVLLVSLGSLVIARPQNGTSVDDRPSGQSARKALEAASVDHLRQH